MKLKKRKERSNSKTGKRLKIKEMKTEKENTSCEINRRNKLLVKDFSSRTAQVKREKVSSKYVSFLDTIQGEMNISLLISYSVYNV